MGDGGDGGAGGSGRPAPERYERCPQPWAPGPQPQGDGRSPLSGGGGMAAGERSVRRFRRPNGAVPASAYLVQEPRPWARADAQVLAERGYRRFLRPGSAAHPTASAERVAPLAPSLPQSSPPAVQVVSPPAQGRRRGQRAARFHERRRRGERWCRRSGMVPCSDGEHAGNCGGGALLRQARQPYGEGPGRSRSGPISIR